MPREPRSIALVPLLRLERLCAFLPATEGYARNRGPGKLNLPNVLTATRLALIPVLWALALSGTQRELAIGIAIAVSTDVLDGLIARAFNVRTELGSRLDSIADHLLSVSVLVWLVLLKPDFAARFAPWLIALAALGVGTLAVGWFRFRRVGDLHLYSSKLAMVMSYLLIVALFFFDTYDPMHVRIVIGLCFVAIAESLAVYLTRSQPGERIGSILLRPSSARRDAA
jgi:cardiolipin synthase (CMP-forming)